MTASFLNGVRVLEVGGSRAAGFAGKLLTDLGAEVWLVEPPGGNLLRRRAPLLADGVGGLFHFLARGKRSVCVNLDHPDGRELVRRLAGACDGAIADRADWRRLTGTSFAGSMAEPEIDEPQSGAPPRGRNGPLAIATVSSRGEPNPLGLESEFVDYHEGGAGYMTPGNVADARAEYPLDLAPGGQASYMGGLYTAIALLQALMLAEQTSEPVHNDVSNQAALASLLVLNVPWFEYAGVVPTRLPAGGQPTRSSGGTVRVRDGRIVIQMIEEHQWEGLRRAIGDPEWMHLPIFATQQDRGAHSDALRACLEDQFKDMDGEQVMVRCQAENVPVFTIRGMEQILASAHERARGFFSPAGPEGTLLPSSPWIVDGAPVASRAEIPDIGAQTLDALRLIGLDADDYAIFRQVGAL